MEKKKLQVHSLHTDVLIIGGGTAGCYAALTISRNSDLSILIAEKANIERSGCLAAGVNAINAYIPKGRTPMEYAEYAIRDSEGIARKDLLLSAAERFCSVTKEMEQLGLVILKDENGDYVSRGNWNIKINGENFKPMLAKAVKDSQRIKVLNHVNITDLLTVDHKVGGAVGFSVKEEIAYKIYADFVLVATGGAAGLYRPNNPGFSRHKMWYSPFNTGAGYAMGIRAGAEMTSFEMRFIALRCKDTIAPTGTIAQGVGAKQINSKGIAYEDTYGITSSARLYGTVRENQLGNGPCYLKTSMITEEQEQDLFKAYLNMAPSQTLKWVESGKGPREQDVEIQGTEPYIVGGHAASGYWVNTNRETTIHGLYAAGDVAGGCPQKYVTGALAEGEIAAIDIIRHSQEKKEAAKKSQEKREALQEREEKKETLAKRERRLKEKADAVIADYEMIYKGEASIFSAEELEEAMQKIMDKYAGGISTHYQFNEKQLELADTEIDRLIDLSEHLSAENMHELLFVYEIKERLTVCKSVIAHLQNRKETRWHSFNENMDYPLMDNTYNKYLNSIQIDGKLQMIFRDIVEEAEYEHMD